ncbi:TetR/AcrR family transcriptional regulator [Agromyces sp. CF514]|uniref:TetR/AcrR family transcriptional regulator n=1 Tax=Agromyces sp. CF514 TaxID=1881031 RepID=UPI000B86ADAD|nr:TetR/AcrR family transcriptional regulator [Agromyces sp. CF514]
MTDSEPFGTRPGIAANAEPAPRARGGRPRASSRRTLEDAASELFLEQGYARTTIDQIAQRAGVGRNTFFNYFAAKSDLLWLDADETIAALPGILERAPEDVHPSDALEHALTALAARHPHGAVPIALSQREPMATYDEFLSAGLGRYLAVGHALAAFLTERVDDRVDPTIVRAAANAATAAAATAAGGWALKGVERGDLAAEVARAAGPVCRGFATLLDPAPAD